MPGSQLVVEKYCISDRTHAYIKLADGGVELIVSQDPLDPMLLQIYAYTRDVETMPWMCMDEERGVIWVGKEKTKISYRFLRVLKRKKTFFWH